MPKKFSRTAARDDALRAAERAVEQARLDLANWKLTGNVEEIERKRAKLARREAARDQLRHKMERKNK